MRISKSKLGPLLLLSSFVTQGCATDDSSDEDETSTGETSTEGDDSDTDPDKGEDEDAEAEEEEADAEEDEGEAEEEADAEEEEGEAEEEADAEEEEEGDSEGGVAEIPEIEKELVKDLVPDLMAPGGLVYEKIEGLAVTAAGNVWIVNDNDGVDDNSGETQLMNLGDALNGAETPALPSSEDDNFNRIASFAVCSQTEADCNTDDETAAEIVAVSDDGNTLIYTDSPAGTVGFVDITTATAPAGLGTTALSGEPTSVAVLGDLAVVGVNTSTDFIAVSGELSVIDIASRTEETTIDLGGQPDSVAVSPDGDYIAVVIENERDEDLGDGGLPQLPAGKLVIVDSSDADPENWTTTDVDLTGLADVEPSDPEPEYVDINSDNIAVVTLQENNHIVLVDLETGDVTNDFSAGDVDLEKIDATEEDPALISLTESLMDVPREPDGVSWISTTQFATADEGDWNGGSRGFTIFDTDGNVDFASGNTLDHLAVQHGHYPDGRSGNKGNEPENVEFGTYGEKDYLFVASERSSLIFVYDVATPESPVLKQALPTGAAPEGTLAIPGRNLLIVASEEDARGDKTRSVLNIYQYAEGSAQYPTMKSQDREDGTPIPWSAISGLAADPEDEDTLYAVEDSFFQQSRIFTIDTSSYPAEISAEVTIKDSDDVFAGLSAEDLDDAEVEADHESRIDVFDEADLAAMINDDKTINIDAEGIAVASGGGFWVASEGSGTKGDADRPINSLDLIFKVSDAGVIEEVITLPDELNDIQLRFGFEGITEDDGKLYVAFQRAWGDDESPRIGQYDIEKKSWAFFFYPLDEAESQNGGWVGLSDLTALGDGEFLVIERDNQGGPDAAIKKLYKFDISELTPGNE